MRALVTGDAGFLGRHFRAALEVRGYDVAGCDPKGRPPIASEVLRFRDCRELFTHHRGSYDLVIHAAAVIGGRAKIDGDPLALAENLELDAAMFRWAVRTRPGRVVYLSSSAVYPVAWQGDAGCGLLAETDIDLEHHNIGVPDRVYGWSKLVGEALAAEVRAAGVPVTVVRPFSGYGLNQGLDYPFPAFIDRAKRRVDPFEVWGDGHQVRDFVHVDDLVAATLTAAASGVDGPMNICTGQPTSLDDLARLVCQAVGYQPELRHHPDAPRGVAYRVGDPSRLLEVYQAKVTLEEGIRRALETE